MGKGLQLKTSALLVWLVKSLKNLQMINLLITRKKCGLFTNFCMVLGLLDQQQIIRQFHLIELLRLLTILGLYPMILTGFGMLATFINFSGQIFGLILSFLGNQWLQGVLDGKSSQEYPVNTGFSERSILDPKLFQLYINDHSNDVICNIGIYADHTTP